MAEVKVRFKRELSSKLSDAMINEEHLAEAIRREPAEPVPGQPGLVMCNLLVAVPRASDPETARLRRVAVTMSHTDDTVEVVRLDGLTR